MKTNKYLLEFQRTFDIMEDCFLEGLMLLADIPQELHEQAIKSCEQCLSSLAYDLEHFKRKALHINQFHRKTYEMDDPHNHEAILSDLVKELKRGFSLIRSDLFTEYGSLLPHALRHLDNCDERLEQLERQIIGGNHAS